MQQKKKIFVSALWIFLMLTLFVSVSAAAARPANPTSPKASVTGQTVTLTWNKVSGASGYYIYSCKADGSDAVRIDTVKGGGTCVYTDTSVSYGTRFYKICSYVIGSDGNTVKSLRPPVVTATVRPSNPASPAAKAVGRNMILTWDKTEGADGYYIYSCNADGSAAVRIAAVTGGDSDIYVIPSVVYGTHSYKICSYVIGSDGNTVKSLRPPVVTATVRPDNPSGTAAVLSDHNAVLTWETVSDASGYYIYRCNADGSEAVRIAAVTGKDTCTYTVENISAGANYYKVCSYVTASGTAVKSFQPPVVTVVKKPENPADPTAIAVGSQVVLQWKKVPEADGYYIYTCEEDGSGAVRIASVAGGNTVSFTDENTVPGSRVFYKICSTVTVNGTTYKSMNPPVVKAADAKPLNPQTTASAGRYAVTVQWSPVKGAAGYYVYSCDENGENTVRIATVTGESASSYTVRDLPVGRYYYKVCSYVIGAGSSAVKSYGPETVTAAVLPENPANAAGKGENGTDTLTWEKVPGAAGYYIYSCKADGSSASLLKTVTGENTVSCTVGDIATGKTSYYKICSFALLDGKTVRSYYPDVVTVLNRPANPTGAAAAAKDGSSLCLTWNAVPGAAGYYVYRQNGGAFTRIATVTGGSSTSYTDTGLAAGQEYSYKICSYVMYGGSSVKSLEPPVITGKPAPAAPENPCYMASGLTAATLYWDPVKDASGYYVYRFEELSGAYTRIDVPGQNTTSYRDTGLVSQKTYYYKICAYTDTASGRVRSDPGTVLTMDNTAIGIRTQSSENRYPLSVGGSFLLQTIVTQPSSAGTTNTRYTYRSSDPSVVTVTAAGNITGKKAGNAVVYVTNENGAMDFVNVTVKKEAVAMGLDISKYQGILTEAQWNAIKAQGYTFVILRAGYGLTEDPAFAENARGALRNGLDIGAYWFGYSTSAEGKYQYRHPTSGNTVSFTEQKTDAELKALGFGGYELVGWSAAAEAEYCAGVLEPFLGKMAYPVYFDWEEDSWNYAVKQGVTPTKTLITDMTVSFVQTMEDAGWYCGFYANRSYMDSYYDRNQTAGIPLWFARYQSSVEYECGLHQFTSIGKVETLETELDIDIAYTDYPKYIRTNGWNGYGS